MFWVLDNGILFEILEKEEKKFGGVKEQFRKING